MCHKPLLDANFYAYLLRIDEEIAAKLQAGGCRRCGCALHKNRYQRKPRGGGLIVLGREPHFQLSLSCSKCQKRHTPESVRFLGRRVYLAATVIMAGAVRSGLTGRWAARLARYLCVPLSTIKRWLAWWRQDFVESLCWKNVRGRFMPPVATETLPASILERLKVPDLLSQLVALLKLLATSSEGRRRIATDPTEVVYSIR
jgi:hypothetical protein